MNKPIGTTNDDIVRSNTDLATDKSSFRGGGGKETLHS